MTRVRRQSASQAVYLLLREDIIRGRFLPLERLYEQALTQTLQVSRTPLREALRKLEIGGFVNQLPTGGLIVAGIDVADVRNLYLIRSVLESLVAREAAEKATPADVMRLRDVVVRMELLAQYPEEAVRLGGEFHGELASIANNPRCDEILAQVRAHLERYWALTVFQDSPRAVTAAGEHQTIVDAIAAGDGTQAEAAMRRHILSGSENVADGVRQHIARLNNKERKVG